MIRDRILVGIVGMLMIGGLVSMSACAKPQSATDMSDLNEETASPDSEVITSQDSSDAAPTAKERRDPKDYNMDFFLVDDTNNKFTVDGRIVTDKATGCQWIMIRSWNDNSLQFLERKGKDHQQICEDVGPFSDETLSAEKPEIKK